MDLPGHYITYRGHRESQGTEKPPCQCETDHKRKFYFLPSSTAFFENGMINKKRDTCTEDYFLIFKIVLERERKRSLALLCRRKFQDGKFSGGGGEIVMWS